MQYKISEFNSPKHIPELRVRGIYKIETSDNKCYVGSTERTFRHRWTGHLHYLRNNKHHSQYLQNVFNKYGEDNLTFSVLEVVENKDDVIEREQYWIDLLQPVFNVLKVAGSTVGYQHTPEWRLKRSKKYREQMSFEGVVITKTGRFLANIYVRSHRVHLGCYGTREEALKAREKGKITFWNDSIDAMSEEELSVFLKEYRESRNGYLMMPSETGEYYIQFQRNRFIFKHTKPKYHYKSFKTLEEAVIYRDAYLASGCTLETPEKVANSGEKHIRISSSGAYRVYLPKYKYDKSFKTLKEAVEARDSCFGNGYIEPNTRKPPKSGHKYIRQTSSGKYEVRYPKSKLFPTLEQAISYRDQYLSNLKASH